MSFFRSERGAVAVEFALVLPILLMILVGIMEFGKAYNTQISLTHTARETARSMVVNNDKAAAEATGIAAAGFLNTDEMDIDFSSDTCAEDQMLEVVVAYPHDALTGIFDDMTITGKAAMRCGG